jgi:hypothetical protein
VISEAIALLREHGYLVTEAHGMEDGAGKEVLPATPRGLLAMAPLGSRYGVAQFTLGEDG